MSTSAVTVEERFNYFVFTASNNVVGSDEFQYKFTWIRLDSKYISWSFDEKKDKNSNGK